MVFEELGSDSTNTISYRELRKALKENGYKMKMVRTQIFLFSTNLHFGLFPRSLFNNIQVTKTGAF